MKVYRFISVMGDSVDRVLVWDDNSTEHRVILETLIPIGKGYNDDWTLEPHIGGLDVVKDVWQVRSTESINGYHPLIGFFTITDVQMMGVPMQLVDRTY